MKSAIRLCLLLAILAFAHSRAATLDLAGYQDQRGAITVHYRGDFVDPYFSIKALLTAYHAGLDISAPGRQWIEWLLPRQEASGLFQRFCLQNGEWVACKEADADDALMALWIELLYVIAPQGKLPAAWAASADLAGRQLDRLWDAKTGIYHISQSNPVGLFIDNVEIYAALRDIGLRQKRIGGQTASRRYLRRAFALRLAIERVFRPNGNGLYRVSTQDTPGWHFYPEEVAQIYPLLHNMPIAGMTPRYAFDAWLSQYGADWLSLARDEYPWGLVAVAALTVDACQVAHRWAERALPLRHGPRWNVLEEAALQAVENAESPSGACHTEHEAR